VPFIQVATQRHHTKSTNDTLYAKTTSPVS